VQNRTIESEARKRKVHFFHNNPMLERTSVKVVTYLRILKKLIKVKAGKINEDIN
jgi:hypothetical protein